MTLTTMLRAMKSRFPSTKDRRRAWFGGVTIVVGGSLAGCSVDRDRYPEGWAEIAGSQDDSCQYIAGTYLSDGQHSKGGPSRSSLPDYLKVELEDKRINPSTVTLRVINATTLEATMNFPAAPSPLPPAVATVTYECDDGVAYLHRKFGQDTTDHEAVTFVDESKTLSRAEDGALIFSYSGTGTGVAFLLPMPPFPFASTRAHFVRFPPAEPQAAKVP